MAKAKTLSEAAAEILSGSLSSARATADTTFGSAGHTPSVHSPAGTIGKASVAPEVNGDEIANAKGVKAGVAAAPKATPPGATPPIGKEAGKSLPGKGQGTVSINKDAVAEETVEEETPPVNEDTVEEETVDENSAVEEAAVEEDAETTNEDAVEEDTVEEETVEEEVPVAETVKEAVAAFKLDVSADIKAMFEGVEVPAEFVAKATSIYETALKTSLVAIATPIVEAQKQAYSDKLDEAVETVFNTVTEKTTDFMTYVVENWTKENQIPLETTLRTELTEEFIFGLKHLFAESYIDVPEDKVNVVEELGQKVKELEEKLNEETGRNVDLHKRLNEAAKTTIVSESLEGLTDTQADKLKSLVENVPFTTTDEFTAKVAELKANYFAESKAVVNNTTAKVLFETVDAEPEEPKKSSNPLNVRMEHYEKALTRTVGSRK